ncbi:MAG TPA: hypothetical protein PKA88_14370 [Polyangiaceae bacterium]|nr:hypothetical protein [Polyangiaceae bacterium]HMR73660.1 hypothetical protein [Polyangiaceae bacterium]
MAKRHEAGKKAGVFGFELPGADEVTLQEAIQAAVSPWLLPGGEQKSASVVVRGVVRTAYGVRVLASIE